MNLNELNTLTNEEKIALYKKMEASNEFFVKMVFPHILTENLTAKQKLEFEAGTLDEDYYMPPFHKIIYAKYDKLLAGEIDNLGLVLFRGAAKSTIKRLITIKAILFKMKKCIVFISESQEQASKDVIAVQNEIENNPIIKAFWGNVKGDIWNKNSATFNVNGFIVYLEAAGMNTRIRGIHYDGNRPDFILPDDFESESNSSTEKGRNGVMTKINSQILRMGNYKYSMAFMGTIVHQEAFLPTIKHLDRFKPPYGDFFEQMISDTPSVYIDPRTGSIKADGAALFKIGEPAWKSRYGKEYLKREMNYYSTVKNGERWWEFLQELYNVPASNSKPTFNADMILPLPGDDVKFMSFGSFNYISRAVEGRMIQTAVNVYDGFDPASGREEVHDRSIKCTVAITPNDDIIIIDIFAGKIDIDDQADLIYKSGIKNNVKMSTIESYGYQLGLVNLVRKKMKKARSLKVNGVTKKTQFYINEYSRKIGKDSKYKEYLVRYINKGKVFYLPGCKNIDLLKRELANYSTDEHDDTIDALYLAIHGAAGSVPKDVNVEVKLKAMRRNIKNVLIFKEPKRKHAWQTL